MGSRSLADDFRVEIGSEGEDGGAVPSPAPLARRPDFKLGQATIRPSLRSIEGPDDTATAEPRVMQVLLALADAKGAVLTRDDLIRLCWNGTIVGDDAVNRAIAELRKIVRASGAGFTVETIPKIGYRLSGASDTGPVTGREHGLLAGRSRRQLLIGGAAALAATVAAGTFVLRRDPADPRVPDLVERGRRALRESLPDSDAQGVSVLRRAVALEPDNSEAWGLLALALRRVAENADPARTTAAIRACEAAARRALALDPADGNALTALATVQPFFGEWFEAEEKLRAVLAVAPNNIAAIDELVLLLQSAGRARSSWNWNERSVMLDSLSPVSHYRKALKLWIFGRVGQADQVVERALLLWPRHPAVWNARLMIFAFTGRAEAAIRMIEDDANRPESMAAPAMAVWRSSLAALDSRSSPDIAKARKENMEAAPRSPGFAVNAIMVLSLLGEVDAAFTVADGYLLRRGPLIGTLWTGAGQMPVNDQRWRRTMMLFTPAAAAMRSDIRFPALCEGCGLADYWKRRGVAPDFPIGPASA